MWTLVAVLAVAVAAAAWIGVRGFLAYGHLRSAQDASGSLVAALSDPDVASTRIASIAADTHAAHELTSDPVWTLAQGLPWVGPQLAAVGTIAAALDDVATSGLDPLAEVASEFSIDSLRPTDGAIDIAALSALAPAAQAGAEGVVRAADAVDAIDDSALVGALRAPVQDVRTLLSEARVGADALARASTLMPAMLGADGPRNYLVVFQNNAEWRSLGGIVGAMAVVSTDGGRMSLSAQASSSDFERFADPVIPLADDVQKIYDSRPARYIQNATQVPDYPVAAQIAKEMWARQFGTQVDGVIALDPVALSYLLDATGPVTLPTGDVLTSENAVSLLLNEVYLRYQRPAEQDAFFQGAAAAVFDALASGGADPLALIEGLTRAGDEDRLLLWNARPEDQAVLDGTTLQGQLPVTDDVHTTFGVYLNDGTGSKMDYYQSVRSGAAWCGDSQALLEFRVRSDAPADAASLPDYVTGGGAYGLPPGRTRTVVWIYLPLGSDWAGWTADRGGQVVRAGTDGAYEVLSWTTELAPGEEATVTVRADTPRTPDVGVRITPTVNTVETIPVAANCEIAG